jgi:DNA-directed RNA polymerase
MLAFLSLCSIFVHMRVMHSASKNIAVPTHRQPWPRPPACLVARDLILPPQNARITVAGLVILRQRPGTAKGVIFLTLEDETGVVNVIVWRHIYETFRRAVIAGRMLRVTGRLQRAHSVTHVLAEKIEDLSPMLDALVAEDSVKQRK